MENEKYKCTVTLSGQASSLYRGGLDLEDDILYALHYEDFECEGMSDKDLKTLKGIPAKEILNHSTYNIDDLKVSFSEASDGGDDLTVWFELPIFIDFKALLESRQK